MIDTSLIEHYNDYNKQRRNIKMGVAECLGDIRTAAAKLSDEIKKYVIAVAQALLFAQKEEKGRQEKLQDRVCFNQE